MAKKAKPTKLLTYYFHADGQDNNGNNGPSPTDEGWIVAVGTTGDEAVSRLPKKARDKVRAAMKEEKSTTVDDFMADTCGWGVGFSLCNPEDWEQMCLNQEEE